MVKYISCEALDNFFDREIRLYEPCPDKYDAAVELKSASHAIPVADVRPVVLCRDCKNNRHCMIQDFMEDYGIMPNEQNNFFCGYGEREE